jgi:hypothetical protein
MTAIDTDTLTAIEAAPLPYDFFREVHKGVRLALFQLTTDLGSIDGTDADQRAWAVQRVGEIVDLLHAHHHHEDEYIRPLLQAHDHSLSDLVDAGHDIVDRDLDEITRLAAEVAASGGDAAVAAVFTLYRFVAGFTSRYLSHMELEEGDVMTALRAALPVAELFGVDMDLRASVPPSTMCRFIAVMVPAMNPDERTAMLAGMRAGAPSEVFEVFRAAAEASLDAADYNVVAERLGLGAAAGFGAGGVQ